MKLDLQLPDELARRIEHAKDQLPRILELGLREIEANPGTGFSGLGEVLETLAGLPTPEEVLALQPSPELRARLQTLVERSHETGLSPEEQAEWDRYQYLEHLVRMAKAKAHQRLQAA